MLLTIIFLPLLAALTSGFAGRKIGVTGSYLITTISLIITTVLAHYCFYNQIVEENIVSIKLFDWVDSASLLVSFGFHFDSLTVSMLLPVLIVSSLVHLYSIGYMENDPHQQRFFAYLSMFTFFMLILVTADNFLLMFLGWEGVGISSYLLVNFWFTRIQANKSAISALLMNRVGDMFLTIGLFAIISAFGNLDYATVFSLAFYQNENLITAISILLLVGAMAKSAQLGLHIWLPQAMEGPTPVSALIHAATMVTAGVYLLMRASPLLEYSSTFLLLSLWIGGLTSIFAATTGLFQNDLKKVIAYSTCSQLGMLFIAIGLSQSNLALFHLVNHAYFKALLFLAAGSVIHGMKDQQDMRKFGGLIQFLPFTYQSILIGSLSLMAIPFLTGYYSKDLIIESAFGQFQFHGQIIYWLASLTAVFTSLYSMKLIYLTFLSCPKGARINYINSHEPVLSMGLPLIILAFLSIFYGYLFKDLMVGLASPFTSNSLFIHPNHSIMIETEFALPILFKLLPVILTILASLSSFFLYEFSSNKFMNLSRSHFGYNLYGFFNQRYYMGLFLNKFIITKGVDLGYQTNKIIDRGAMELIGPHGLVVFFKNFSLFIAKADTGYITNYALYIFGGLVSFLSLLFIGESQLFFIYLFCLFTLNR